MGRPLRKDVRGTDVINTPAAAATGITIQFHDGTSNRTDGVIIKQRGSRSFVVCRVGDIGDTTKYYTCTLVNTTPNAAGEMLMQGSTTGELDRNLVAISKINKRIAYGFPSVPVLNNSSGNYKIWNAEDSNNSTNHDQAKYTWYLESDSSADYIVLTAI